MAPFFKTTHSTPSWGPSGNLPLLREGGAPGGNNRLSVEEPHPPAPPRFREGSLRGNALTLDLDPEDPEAEDKARMAAERANLKRIEEALASAQEELARLIREGRLTPDEMVRLLQRYNNNFDETLAEAMRRAARQERSDELQQTWRYTIGRTVDEGAAAGLQVSFGQLGNVGISLNYDLLNRFAHDWAQTYSYNLITRIDQSTGRQVGHAVSSWMASGEHLNALIRQLDPTFGRDRAEMIASTETTRAFAEGTLLGYRQSGQVSATEWKTAMDQRVCPICGPLHGESGDLNGNFRHPGGIGRSGRFAGLTMRPPAHVRCRCALAPIVQAAPIVPVAKPVPAPVAQPESPKPVALDRNDAEQVRKRMVEIGQEHADKIEPIVAEIKRLQKELNSAETHLKKLEASLEKRAGTPQAAQIETALKEKRIKYKGLLERETTLETEQARLNDAAIAMQGDLLKVAKPAQVTVYAPGQDADTMGNWNRGANLFNNYVSADVAPARKVSFSDIAQDERASYNIDAQVVKIQKHSRDEIVIHELGHWLEDNNMAVHKKALEFYDRRTKGESLEWMGENYDKNEVTRKDKFLHPYMGKDYGRDATEIVSMGLEYLYTQPAKLASKDPDYFRFMFDLVRGQ